MHVVHLEDESPLREILQAALQAARPDVDIHQFFDSDSALAYIQQNLESINLFILDIRVPGQLDGIALAQKIRELGATGTIVLTSAYTSPTRELLDNYDCMWFPKPWHVMEITQKLLEITR